MKVEKTKANRMGEMPIPKLIFKMSLPAILAMMVQALYNIVDSMFVARIGENALTAVSLAFPIQLIIIACFVGLGVGISSLVSRKIGEKDIKSATLAAEHGFLISSILYVMLAILGLILSNIFFGLFTDNGEIIRFGSDYLRIIMVFSFGSLFAQAGMSILQGSGDMMKPMISQIIGALVNIILDPIFIFGWFGLPAMGVKGAAIATIIGQVSSMCFILFVLFRGNNHLKLDMRNFKYSKTITKQILIVGLPVALMQALGSVMLIGLNKILAGFGETPVAVLGVYFKLQSFVFMPIFGLSQGTMPIIGYNFGAKNKARIMKTIKVAAISAVSFMSIGMIIFQIFPAQLLTIFKSTEEMTAIGVVTFRTISIGYPLAALSIVLGSSFQGMGVAYISMIVSFIRQIVVLLPAAYLLGKFVGLDAVWISFVIAEVIGLIVVLSFFKKIYTSKLSIWDDEKKSVA